MKMNKRLPALLLSILAVFLLLPVPVLAAGKIDLSHDVSLTVTAAYDQKPISGMQFDVYLVAIVDQYGELTPTKTFSQFNVDIRGENDQAWRTLASTLEGYVLWDNLSPTDSGKTDRQGLLSFPNRQKSLTPGLYLVLGQLHTQDGCQYEADPFMVMLPSLDQTNNSWVYEAKVSPKLASHPLDEEENTITRKVLKKWVDDGDEKERRQEAIVQLLRNGKVYDTVRLTAKNNWRYTWTDLERGYRWTLVEKKLDGYKVSVEREGITFVVTNTYANTTPNQPPSPAKPGNPTLPQTGQLWWPVPVLLSAGLLLIVWGLIRRRSSKHEK